MTDVSPAHRFRHAAFTHAQLGTVMYAALVSVIGLSGAWTAPLSWDESRYYLPAARFFAERFPMIPIDYPMPMPPLPLALQGALFSVTGSVAALRIVSSIAAIGFVALFASIAGSHRWAAVAALALGCFPVALSNAFTMKHHTLLLLLMMAGLAQWNRGRVQSAAVLLGAAVLTHQIAAALIGTLVIAVLRERKFRDAMILSLSVVPLAVLFVAWRGARPPMYDLAFANEPRVGLHPSQILVLLVMAGVWLAPTVSLRPRVALAASILILPLMHVSGLLQDGTIYERLAGPVSTGLQTVDGGFYVPRLVGASLLAGLGVNAFAEFEYPAQVWAIMYGLAMMFVPYFFESYYAAFIIVGWVFLHRRLAARVGFPVAVILAGLAYLLLKF